MVVIAEMNILAAGVEDRAGQLVDLPVRMNHAISGADAIRLFKTGSIDSVISHWNLADMPDGQFLKKLKAFKPDMPTVVIVEPGNHQQEIQARMLGVSAVITEDCDSDYFRQVMVSVLGMPGGRPAETLYAV